MVFQRRPLVAALADFQQHTVLRSILLHVNPALLERAAGFGPEDPFDREGAGARERITAYEETVALPVKSDRLCGSRIDQLWLAAND